MLSLNSILPSSSKFHTKALPSLSFSSSHSISTRHSHYFPVVSLHKLPPIKPGSIYRIGKHPFLHLSQKQNLQTSKAAEATAVVAGGDDAEEAASDRLKLAIVFGLWYFQTIVFNIYNKKVLNVFPFPWLLSSFQLFVGSIWMFFLWGFKLQPCPTISKPFIQALLGPALFHTIGHISACVSISKVPVSFTHVIKSAEPVFSVIFTTLLGDNTYPLPVWLSILPIVFGCSLAAVTEVSFNFQGLWGAMISNIGFVFRNIYSKRSLKSFKEVNGLNLYGCISVVSLMYIFPVAVFLEGSQWIQGHAPAIEAAGSTSTLYMWFILSGVFYHLYNQSSYQALDKISPLSFSVGNTMKRVVRDGSRAGRMRIPPPPYPYPPKKFTSTAYPLPVAGIVLLSIPAHMGINLNPHPPHQPTRYSLPTYTSTPSILYSLNSR